MRVGSAVRSGGRCEQPPVGIAGDHDTVLVGKFWQVVAVEIVIATHL
jgi:hypothetical protein